MHHAADVEHRQPRCLLGFAAHLRPVTLGVHPVLDVGDRTPVAANVEIEEVDGAIRLERLHEPHALVDAVSTIHVLIHGEAKTQRDWTSHSGTDAVDDGAQETQSIVVAATELV